jgi:hypothetical protein
MDLCVHGKIRICEGGTMTRLELRLHDNVLWCQVRGYVPKLMLRDHAYAAIHAPYHAGQYMALHIFNLWVGIDW